ncbi:MAG TPA: hypothetical protein VJS44_20555 [Pyrinomonadaceae bacterium]|nr:hypothetical protein [Pyrinomonadaceae bacterium]
MAMKIENQSQVKLPKGTEERISAIMESLPKEHLRGIDRIRLVDSINDPRLKALQQKTELPGLYHPRMGGQPAWLEIAVGTLLPSSKPIHKRIMPRLSFKGNLAAILFSLVGQHYYLTLRHSVKRGQIETSVRAYTEKHLKLWNERQHGLRAKLFKPLQPMLERWARTLQKKASAERKKSQSA